LTTAELAPPTGGSGLRGERRAHGWPPMPPSPPTSPSPPACRCVDRGVDSPEAARVGRAPGVAAAASYSGGQRGVRGRPRSAWGRGARRDGEAMTGAPRFGFGRQPKR
jgi:hypothetical protein